MTGQKLEEKIDLAIYSEITPISGIGGAQLVEAIRRIRNKILALVKEALPELAKEDGYVKLADDQSLPPLPLTYFAVLSARNYGQDMLRAGWRKVEL